MKHFTKKELDEHLLPLYKTSKDNNSGEYLLPSNENYKVYHFDKLAELIGNKYRRNKSGKSADAFFINKNDQYQLLFYVFVNVMLPYFYSFQNILII